MYSQNLGQMAIKKFLRRNLKSEIEHFMANKSVVLFSLILSIKSKKFSYQNQN